MSSYQSHITVLQHSASSYPDASVFRVPRLDQDGWSSISYRQFKDDVEFTARYWRQALESDGISEHSVVGLWYVYRNVPSNLGL